MFIEHASSEHLFQRATLTIPTRSQTQAFQSGDADFRKEEADIAGDYHHRNWPRSLFCKLICTLDSINASMSPLNADEVVRHIDLSRNCRRQLFETA
jgi:hypothetical protein